MVQQLVQRTAVNSDIVPVVQTLQTMLSATQQDLEAFLTQVYRAIAGAAPLKDKVSPVPCPAANTAAHHALLSRALQWKISFRHVRAAGMHR